MKHIGICALVIGLLIGLPAFAADQPSTAPAGSAGNIVTIMTNTGEELPVIFEGHRLRGQPCAKPSAEAVTQLRQQAVELGASQARTAASTAQPQTTNHGELATPQYTGHALTVGRGAGGVLYAPAHADAPAFRAALGALLGVPVDYYDARVDTPSLALLCTYDAVFTWPNWSYADAVAFGDRLADYVDVGCGTVILGQWCLPTQIYWLEGRIMQPGYCPVDAEDDTRESRSYAGDGVNCVHDGPPFVGAYQTQYRDDCTLRTGNLTDGTYTDGFLSVAWRPDRRVYYSAGNTGYHAGSGEWADLTANMIQCPLSGGILYAPTNPDNPSFRIAVAECTGKPCDYFDARVETPSLGLLMQYDCVFVWINYACDDAEAFGNVLADYVDYGGKVILGQWCYPSDQGNSLSGRIITPAYCPVTTLTSYKSGNYAGDGTDCVHNQVSAYGTSYLDHCVLNPGALSDGTLSEGSNSYISVAWRPDRAVYYSAGNTGNTYGSGDWPLLICNMCACYDVCGDPGAGSCCTANMTPGCDDAVCCASVCEYDSYCCNYYWDSICAQHAAQDLNCLDCVCADETTAPVVQITDPPELGAGCACGLVEVKGTANDPDGTFSHYTLAYRRIGTPTWTVITDSDIPVIDGPLGEWDTTGLTQGYYMLRLVAVNICGLTAVVERPVFVDQGYDTVTIDYPPTGHVIAGNVCIDGTVFESWCGSEYSVSYRPSGAPLWLPVDPTQPTYAGTAVNEPFAWWDTTMVANGQCGLRVRAWNDCGVLKTTSISVIIDNTWPTAEIDSPADCQFVEGLVPIIGTAYDVNLHRWVLQYTGGGSPGWQMIAQGSAAVVDDVLAVWDTTGLPTCAYTLRLRVYDQAEIGCSSGDRHYTDYMTSVFVNLDCRLPGDMNCDGLVNSFDIDPFVLCLTTGDCDCPD